MAENRRSPKDQKNERDGDRRRRGHELQRKLTPQPRQRQPLLAWVIFVFLAIMAFQLFLQNRPTEANISYTRFMREVDAGNIASVGIVERQLEGELISPTTFLEGGREIQFFRFKTWLPFEDPELLKVVAEKNPEA